MDRSENEKMPLLNHATSAPPTAPPVFHQYQQYQPVPGYQEPPPPYAVADVSHHYNTPISEQSRQSTSANTASRCGCSPWAFVAIIALGIVFILLFGILFFRQEKRHDMPKIIPILWQSAPTEQGYRDITIPQGTLRGFTRNSRQGREFTAFYKVPYAEPPLGELRFKDPVAPRGGWEGIREISEVAPQCIQKEKYAEVVRAVGEEDCLYANIYRPSTESTELLPTMVYIHGGGFTDGNGSRYGPEYFMDEDVVLLTFQYRLGPFGFLNTNDDVIRGNMGFKDQVQMLQWTKSNIHHFGGDPDRVTIFGNSAGGMSVSFLMLSPMANGLFHRAITQSGAGACAQTDIVFDPNPEVTVHEVEMELRCNASNTSAFVECLNAKSAEEVALVRTPKCNYGLTVEWRQDNQVFMPDYPYNMIRDDPNKVSYMIGVVNSEWFPRAVGILTDELLVNDLNQNWGGVAGNALNLNMSSDELISIKQFYFGDKEIGNDTLRETIDMASDRWLIHCSYVSARMHGQFSPTYLYYISKPPYHSYADKVIKGFPAKEMGILSHADELQYFFLYDGYPEITVDDQEYFEFSKYLVKTWATFARDGEPQKEWEKAVGQNETFWFELNDTPARTDKVKENMDFWDGFTHQQLKYSV